MRIMMKRWLCGLLTGLMLLQLAGCQPSGESSGEAPDATDTTTSAVSSDSVSTTTVGQDAPTSTAGGNAETPTTAGGNTPTKTPVQTTKGSTTTKTVADKVLPGSVKIWTENALTDVFETTAMPAGAATSGAIHMLKNEAESIQLAIRPEDGALTDISVTVEPVDGLTITAYQIGNIPYSKYSTGIGKYRRANTGVPVPEYYLDPDDTWRTVKKDVTRSFCIEAVSTASTKAGTYKTNILIRTAQGVRALPLSVRVYNGTLPKPADSDVDYVCWTDNGSAVHTFGVDWFSEEFWEICKVYAQTQKKERQNVMYLNLRDFLLPAVTVKADGSYQFDWTNFDKYIEIFLKYGSYKYIAGSHLTSRDYYIAPNDPSWPTNAVDVWTFAKKGNGQTVVEWQYADSEAGVRHLQNLLGALYAHLKEKGWDKMWLQFVSDEVDGKRPEQQVALVYGKVHEFMPTCRTVDAGFTNVMSYGGERLDIPAPRLDAYHEIMDACKAYQKAGETLWTYTCNGPKGNAMSRMNDFPLLSTRALGWYMWQHGIDGYLHWAWNSWTGGVYNDIYCADPYAVGDCFLVYPNGADYSIREGTRATAMRDALEDNELMRLAAEKNKQKVQSVVDALISNYASFERDPDKYLEARIQFLEMLG